MDDHEEEAMNQISSKGLTPAVVMREELFDWRLPRPVKNQVRSLRPMKESSSLEVRPAIANKVMLSRKNNVTLKVDQIFLKR